MPLNKETKPNQTKPVMKNEFYENIKNITHGLRDGISDTHTHIYIYIYIYIYNCTYENISACILINMHIYYHS